LQTYFFSAFFDLDAFLDDESELEADSDLLDSAADEPDFPSLFPSFCDPDSFDPVSPFDPLSLFEESPFAGAEDFLA
jgi:hypothetical protein